MNLSFDENWYKNRYCLTYGDEKGRFNNFEDESSFFLRNTKKILFKQLCDSKSIRLMIDEYQTERQVLLKKIDHKFTHTASLNSVQHPNFVIFSAIAKEYDSLKIPHFLDPKFDYILFSDSPQRETGIWQIRPIPFWNKDATRITRYVKLHPHVLFPDYSLAMWVDQNVLLLGDFEDEIKAFLATDLPIATFYHPTRTNIQDECLACMKLRKDNSEVLKQQLIRYHALNVDNFDLANTNVMLFNLKHPLLPKILTTWWAELEQYSKRDQLSFSFAVASHNAQWYPLAHKGICPSNHPKFGVVSHDKNHGIAASIAQNVSSHLTDPFSGESFYANRQSLLNTVSSVEVDICICIHNALDAVKNCLASLVAKRRGPQDRILLIDDGSDAATQEFLHEFCQTVPAVLCIRNETPQGYVKAANRALKNSSSPIKILLNSDTIVTDDWVAKMVLALKESYSAEIVGVLSNAADMQSLPSVEQQGNNTVVNTLPKDVSIDDMNRFCEQWSCAHIYPRVPLVHGFCFGLTQKALDILGGFDEIHFPKGYGEENDFSFRASNAGIDQVIATNTYIYHAKSQSFRDQERIFLMQQGIRTLISLYGEHRNSRACKTVLQHPILVEMRRKALALYTMIDEDVEF